jgi:hypothetical protein
VDRRADQGFLAHVRQHRLYALFHMVTLRGLRLREAAGLAWADLDLDAWSLAVSSQLQQLGWRIVTAPPKSDAGRLVVALDATTVAALREHLARQQAERDAAGARWHGSCTRSLSACQPGLACLQVSEWTGGKDGLLPVRARKDGQDSFEYEGEQWPVPTRTLDCLLVVWGFAEVGQYPVG